MCRVNSLLNSPWHKTNSLENVTNVNIERLKHSNFRADMNIIIYQSNIFEYVICFFFWLSRLDAPLSLRSKDVNVQYACWHGMKGLARVIFLLFFFWPIFFSGCKRHLNYFCSKVWLPLVHFWRYLYLKYHVCHSECSLRFYHSPFPSTTKNFALEIKAVLRILRIKLLPSDLKKRKLICAKPCAASGRRLVSS